MNSENGQNEYQFEHQIERSRFVIIKDEKECVLDYVIQPSSDKTTIDFNNTYVPFALRGQGLAEVLVEAGLAWAKAQGYQLEASCWYVKKFLPAT